jgi:hypothetical protein
MIDVDKTRLALDQIAHAKDPLGLVRELVLASGGTWLDTATVDMAFLFEVNLHGVRGFGLGASAAIDNWIANTKGLVNIDESLSAQIASCNTSKQAQCTSE